MLIVIGCYTQFVEKEHTYGYTINNDVITLFK
jgi:hypothetical protein